METSNSSNRSETRPGARPRWQVQVFLVCLLISAFIWLLIKLSKEYVTEFTCPVVFVNIPSGKVFSGTTDSVLLVSVKANGYNTLARKWFKPDHHITVDLSALKLNRNGDYFEGTVTKTDLEERVTSQLKKNEKLESISPSSIFFRCENASFKKVPVKLNLDVTLAKKYLIYGEITYEPDSITVTGPPDKIASIVNIATDARTLSNLKENQTLSIPLRKRPAEEHISFSSNSVKVLVPVAEYKETTVTIPVVPDSVLEKYSVKIIPEKVKITYHVALSDADMIKESMFKAVIRYRMKLNKRHNITKVELARKPALVRVVSIEPEQVEYTIVK